MTDSEWSTDIRADDCAHCGGEFDRRDPKCPHCGVEDPAAEADAARLANRGKNAIGCMIRIVVLVAVLLLYYKACVEPLP